MVGREHPGLGRRTLVLIMAWFVPYLLAAVVLPERVVRAHVEPWAGT